MSIAKLDRSIVAAEVLDAARRLAANGQSPTIPQLQKLVPYGDKMVREARGQLVDDGLLILPANCTNFRPDLVPNDGVTEIPDDPDAGEIEARIAVERAGKWMSPGYSPSIVMRARCMTNQTRPREAGNPCLCEDSGSFVERRISMKAITLHQPYATLWAAGLKIHETRGWSTTHRGILAVHAGKTREGTPDDDWLRENGLGRLCPVPYGSVVGVVRIVDCKRTSNAEGWPLPWVNELGQFERLVGGFGEGRFGWEAVDARLLEAPIPMRGQQGLFDLPADVEAMVRDQLKGGAI